MSIITTTINSSPGRDYFWLVEMIEDWLHRTDLAAKTQNFIVMAEMRIKTLLEARIHESVSIIQTAAGVASAELPDLLLRTRSLSIPNVMPSLSYLTPGQLEELGEEEAGAPRFYTTVDSTVYFRPIPDAVYSVTCHYRTEALALSAESPTNSLLTRWPNVYLFGALVEAADWAGDDASLAKWQAKFQSAIAGINVLDWHAGGPMCVRSDVRSI